MRRYRLTSLQETILLTAMNEPGRYLSVIHYRLSDKPDEQTIKSRLTKLAGRHEALRTVFVRDENGVFWHEVTDYINEDLFKIEIKGDENLVEQVKYVLQDGRLILSSNNKLYCDNNLKISLKTNDLKSISTGFIGNVQMNSAFYGEELKIGMSGAGNFSADSLFINSLTVNSGGIASIRLSGKANKAQFDLSGAGKIDAFELVSDTVFARVNGVGSIQCNPLEYLDGRLLGIGKITYKQEPKSKKFVSAGIGRMKWR